MTRLRPSQLAQAGATSGQGLLWNGTEWAPAAVGSGSALHVSRSVNTATAGQTTLTLGATPYEESLQLYKNGLILASGYTVSGAVVTFTTALAAGDVIVDQYWTTATAPAESVLSGGGGGEPALSVVQSATYGDTFSGSSLAAKWNRVGFTAADETYQTDGGSAMTVSGRPAGSYYWQTAPSGDYEVIWVGKVTATTDANMFGAMVVNASGTGIFGGFYNSTPNGPIVGTITNGSYTGGFESAAGPTGTSIYAGTTKVWLRVKKTGTGYQFATSTDGATWLELSAAHANATAMTRIGFGCVFGSITSMAVDVFDVR